MVIVCWLTWGARAPCTTVAPVGSGALAVCAIALDVPAICTSAEAMANARVLSLGVVTRAEVRDTAPTV